MDKIESERIREWLIDELHLLYHKAAGDREREDELINALVWVKSQCEKEKERIQKENPINDTDEKIVEAVKNTSVLDMIEESSTKWSEEDEMIRKALISILKSDFEKDTTIYDISVGDIIAWLENRLKGKRFIFSDKAKHQEWGEKDESMINSIISKLKEIRYLNVDSKIDWLKSLKDRFIPQPRQWLSEDERYLKAIATLIKGSRHAGYDGISRIDAINWLYSLREIKNREQVRPLDFKAEDWYVIDGKLRNIHYTENNQNLSHWKPSSEQLSSLWNAISGREYNTERLKSLYIDLKIIYT